MHVWNVKAPYESERAGPRVLFSTPEARGVVVDLEPEEELREHRVRERAVVLVVFGSIDFTAADRTMTCGEGTLVLLEPGEHHAMLALEQSRLLLALAPWPAADHYYAGEHEDPHELPAKATQPEGL